MNPRLCKCMFGDFHLMVTDGFHKYVIEHCQGKPEQTGIGYSVTDE